MSTTTFTNEALGKIGASQITTLTDGSVNATLASALYPGVYKEVFRTYDWKCLRRCAVLPFTSTTLTLSLATVGTGRTATAGAAHFTSDDVDRILYEVDADGADSDGVAVITGYTSSTIVTVEITTAFSATTFAANLWRLEPLQDGDYDWAYEYNLPSTCLKVRAAAADSVWEVHGRRLVSDADWQAIDYTYYDTDESAWDPLLYQAVLHRYAAALAEPIARDKELVGRMMALYQAKLVEAVGADQVETSRRSYLPTFTSQGR